MIGRATQMPAATRTPWRAVMIVAPHGEQLMTTTNPVKDVSRRAFLAASAASLALATTTFAADEKKIPAGDYVDMHTHLGQTWNTTVPLTAEELLRWMDAHKIAQA